MAELQKTIRGLPRAYRALQGRGALPNVENLQKYDLEDLTRVLGRFGLEPDLAAIERRANKAFDRLEQVLEEGREPDEATWEAIDKDIERQMTETVRQQVKAAIRNREHYRAAQSGASRFIWVTVGDSKVCGSCEPRHGKVKTLAQWDALGQPGSAALVCTAECRCKLVPVVETTGDDSAD